MRVFLLGSLLASALLLGCAEKEVIPPKDGEVAMPSNYSDWPVFMSGIEKSSGHIRDIYINNTGAKVKKGEAFPDGTEFVMAIHNATKGADGKLAKTGLAKVFVMSKGDGYGQDATPKTGEWVYSAFDNTGKPLDVDYTTCRGCHVPLASTDYVFHYDQYFK